METKQENQPKQDKLQTTRTYLIMYLDIALRSLIAFVGIGVILGIVLIGYFKIRIIYVLPISFVISIFISPLLFKIKLGEFALTKFEGLVDKVLNKIYKEK